MRRFERKVLSSVLWLSISWSSSSLSMASTITVDLDGGGDYTEIQPAIDGAVEGDTVLVQGTGGVALAGLAIAKGLGAEVIVLSSSDARLERAAYLGADHCINYSANENWGEEAFNIAGHGVDAVIEIGGTGTLTNSLAAIRHGGHINIVGYMTGIDGPVGDGQRYVTRLGLCRSMIVDNESAACDGDAIQFAHGRRVRADSVDMHAGLEPLPIEDRRG